MKVRSLHLERFKRFEDYKLDFTHPDSGQPLDLVVLVGDNGSGKSTILQAIAMTLGTATLQISHPVALAWPGLDLDIAARNYQGYLKTELEVEFNQSEINATREYFLKSDEGSSPNAKIGNENRVRIEIIEIPNSEPEIRAYNGKALNLAPTLAQFRGRYFAYTLLNSQRAESNMFKQVGSVFWYHDQRTTYDMTPFSKDTFINGMSRRGKSGIRRLITNWFAVEGQPKIKRFRELYEQFFPGKTLTRIGEAFTGEEPPVFFRDENKIEYELAELSGGEQALMPIILDFVQWDINNSIILIDEIELHLHPPLQQTLIAMLPKLGENNQFIITTHSDAVFNVVPSSSVRRINAMTEIAHGQ